ncbi:MAG: Hsp20/alpha crystallin family protein [archaeon]
MHELEEWDPLRHFKRKKGRDFNDFFFMEPFGRELIREPLIDIKDLGKNLKVTAELPGLNKKDIKLEVKDNMLSINAQTKHEKEEKGKNFYFQERKAERFYRKFSLPTEVIAGKSKTEYKNGVLEILLPKKNPLKKEKSSRIKVQ